MAAAAQDVRTDASGTATRILDAAFEAVATFGLSRLTMDDVAGLAGVSRQTVYRYFDSKDARVPGGRADGRATRTCRPVRRPGGPSDRVVHADAQRRASRAGGPGDRPHPVVGHRETPEGGRP